ncbi:sensor histidine kinase [Cryobacterium melibiosiphilum]|nr:PAS domain-containing sensor histidine kinase [Cryobacterium melibiosiphilum]
MLQFLRTQVPFAAALSCLAIFLAIARPALLGDAWMLSALVLGAAATLLSLVLPLILARFRLPSNWLIVTPLLDIVAVVLLREADRSAFAAVGILIVFPVIWMAYSFSRRVLALAMLAAFLVPAIPFAVLRDWPHSPAAWATVTLVPLFVCFLAFSIWIAASTLRRHQRQLESVTIQLREALHAAEIRAIKVDAMINSVEASIVLFDAEGEAILWNDASVAMSQRAGGAGDVSAIGLPLVFAADRVTPVPVTEQVLAGAAHGDLPGGDIVWLGTPGDQAAVIASSHTVTDDDGSTIGRVVVAQDVTELVEATSVRDDFLAAVSDELQTPLTTIVGKLDLLAEDTADSARGLAAIQRSSERLLETVDHLMDAAGPPAITRHRVEVGSVITCAVERIRPAALLAGVEIAWEAGHDLVAPVDGGAIAQILDQLLSNAVKFVGDSGRVRVSSGLDGNNVVIHVADTGIGMSMDEQRQMFDRFFRAPAARAAAVPGAGLGLSIVKSLVAAHGGTVQVKSASGVGTVVTVTVPVG